MSSTPLQSREERAAGILKWVKDARNKGIGIRKIAKVLGVPHTNVQGMLDGVTPQDGTLDRMEAGMIEYEREAAQKSTEPVQHTPTLERRLDEIATEHRDNPYLRMLERENLAAVYLAHALDRAERAAEIRAEAIRSAERASLVRAEAVKEAETSGRARAAVLERARLDVTDLPADSFTNVSTPPPPAKVRRGKRNGG